MEIITLFHFGAHFPVEFDASKTGACLGKRHETSVNIQMNTVIRKDALKWAAMNLMSYGLAKL